MSRRDFQAGDVVLVESPFLSVVLPGPQCHADARACPGNRVFLELSAYRSGDRPCWMNIESYDFTCRRCESMARARRCRPSSGRTWRQRTVTPPPRLSSFARQWTSSTRRTGASACTASASAQTRWHVAGFLLGELLKAHARTHRRQHAHTYTHTHREAFWTFGQAPVYGEKPTAQGIFWTNCIGELQMRAAPSAHPLLMWVLKLGFLVSCCC